MVFSLHNHILSTHNYTSSPSTLPLRKFPSKKPPFILISQSQNKTFLLLSLPPSLSLSLTHIFHEHFYLHHQYTTMSIFSNFPFLLLLILSSFTTPSSSSSSSLDTFVFGGCSTAKFSPGSAYESGINSLLTSFVNAAMFSAYNNFTIPPSSPQDTPLYGLFQCRGDLASPDCSRCVARAVSQLGTICPDSCGGALQLDGCFVRYDNSTFLGVEDKTLVLKKCGPSIGLTSDLLTRRDDVLAYLGTSDGTYKTFRTSSSGNVQGVAQCTGDLSSSECQDCLSDAIGQLRMECGPTQWGQIYLAKCYAIFSEGGDYSRGRKDRNNKNDDELQKTLAIIVGLIAGVALIIIFVSFLTKLCKKHEGHGK